MGRGYYNSLLVINYMKKPEVYPADDNTNIGITIAARSAILDFYGDYSVSFSNQFIASIFGFITACALINAVLTNLLMPSQVNPTSIGFFLIISLSIFVGFIFAAIHTYTRFTFYADLASQLKGFPVCLRLVAKLEELTPRIRYRKREEGIKEINDIYSRLKKECNFSDDAKPFEKEGKEGKQHFFANWHTSPPRCIISRICHG